MEKPNWGLRADAVEFGVPFQVPDQKSMKCLCQAIRTRGWKAKHIAVGDGTYYVLKLHKKNPILPVQFDGYTRVRLERMAEVIGLDFEEVALMVVADGLEFHRMTWEVEEESGAPEGQECAAGDAAAVEVAGA